MCLVNAVTTHRPHRKILLNFQGNEVTTGDERVMSVLPFTPKTNLHGITVKSGTFNLQDKYPKSSSITLAANVRTTFSCSTTERWFDCKWKHPKFDEPCGAFHYRYVNNGKY